MVTITKANLRRWSNMTDNNEHNKVRKSIAKKFGLGTNLEVFKAIEKEHYKVGHLSNVLFNKRSECTLDMLRKIEAMYGSEVKNEISSCL